jgi:hypothetical protein
MAPREYLDEDEDDLPDASDVGRSRQPADDVEEDEERDSEEEEDEEEEEEDEEEEEQDSGRQRKRVKVRLFLADSFSLLIRRNSVHQSDQKLTASSISKSR